jgi:hypothetical protein
MICQHVSSLTSGSPVDWVERLEKGFVVHAETGITILIGNPVATDNLLNLVPFAE